MDIPDLTGRLETALADLASGCPRPSDIARKLETAGCKGHRKGCYSCPVAVWLLQQLDLDDGLVVNVGLDLAVIETGQETVLAEALVPPVVAVFIGMFDHDSFAELVEA